MYVYSLSRRKRLPGKVLQAGIKAAKASQYQDNMEKKGHHLAHEKLHGKNRDKLTLS